MSNTSLTTPITSSILLQLIQEGCQTKGNIFTRLNVTKPYDQGLVTSSLKKLADNNFVELGTQRGKLQTIMLSTPSSLLQKSVNSMKIEENHRFIHGDSLVRLVMKKRDLYLIRDSLELFSRVGIGQITFCMEQVRFGSYTDAELDIDRLNLLETLADRLKFILTGFPSSASYGIYNEKVKSQFRLVWALYRSIRHRLAWDLNPEGGFGVDFDEPMYEDGMKLFVVLSHKEGDEDFCTLQMSKGLLDLTRQALKLNLAVLSGDFGTLVNFVVENLKHVDLADLAKEEVIQRLDVAREVAHQMEVSIKPCLKSFEPARLKLTALLLALDDGQSEEEGGFFRSLSEPLACAFKTLPDGCCVGIQANNFVVVASDPTHSDKIVIGQSHSLQTALMLANKKHQAKLSNIF